MRHNIMNRIMRSVSFVTLLAIGAVPVSVPQTYGLNALPMPPGVDIELAGQTNTSQSIVLGLNKSSIVQLLRPASDVIISNPGIADVTGKTRRQMIFTGTGVGETNAFIFDENGNQIINLEIRVEPDVAILQDVLMRHVPDSRVKVEALNGALILSGNVRDNAEAARVLELSQAFFGDGTVNNMMTVDASDQVMLQVRVIEFQRNASKQLGINLDGFRVAGLNGGEGINYDFGQSSVAGGISLGTVLERWVPIFDRNTGEWVSDELAQQLNTTIQALEEVGVARILAEPNLTVLSGEEGSFLAGGQFPVVAAVVDGVPTVNYQEFGINLDFSPTVISEGRIALTISTGVSSLSSEGAVTQDGFTTPSIATRELTSSVELASGQTMMLAGLIDSETRQQVREFPGLSRIPVLGKLLSSRDFVNSETELVIMVTPYLVNPNRPDTFISPADGFRTPDDLDRNLLGDLNRHYNPNSRGQGLQHYQAPIGFIDE